LIRVLALIQRAYPSATHTGKSTIVLKIAKQLYDAIDVGVLSNNVEKKFGLSAFYDKFIYVAPEIKGDFVLEQAEFQSIVSGEDIQIAAKHKTAFSTTWEPPGILAGNEVPGWIDNSGSIQRRIVVFNFEKTVLGGGDMKLGEKLEAQMPAIIAKCNRAYLEAAAEYGMQNIWNVLPAYFRETRDEMAQSTNSVEAFIVSDDITIDAALFCPFDDFKAALAVWERMNNYRSVKFTADLFRGPFAKFNLTRIRELREYRGQRARREYIVGVDVARHDGGNTLG
jgi:hypothetical protein